MTTKYQHTFTSQQNAFHYLSFDKHFSFLSKHDKSRVILHTVLDLKFVQIKTRQIRNKHTTKTLHNRNSRFGREIWNTHSSMESMGTYQKFVVLNHFELDVLHRESSNPFLFTIYILKSVFCKDNSVEYGFDRCVEF